MVVIGVVVIGVIGVIRVVVLGVGLQREGPRLLVQMGLTSIILANYSPQEWNRVKEQASEMTYQDKKLNLCKLKGESKLKRSIVSILDHFAA